MKGVNEVELTGLKGLTEKKAKEKDQLKMTSQGFDPRRWDNLISYFLLFWGSVCLGLFSEKACT